LRRFYFFFIFYTIWVSLIFACPWMVSRGIIAQQGTPKSKIADMHEVSEKTIRNYLKEAANEICIFKKLQKGNRTHGCFHQATCAQRHLQVA